MGTIKARVPVGLKRPLKRGFKATRRQIRRARPIPGAATAHELSWQLRLRRAPILDTEEHCARTGLKEIEEAVGCSLCDERRVQPLFQPSSKTPGRWSYHVVRCPSCGFLYRNPGIKPERLGDLYAKKGYSKFLTGHYAEERQRRYELVMDAFDPVFRDGSGRRLFDFGSGAGLFLEVAHRRGFDTFGVDLSRSSVKEAHRRPGGANTFYGTPQDVPQIAAGGFDAITMWSVLAHLPCPVEDLTMMRSLLAPGGVLLILTVNANSLQLKRRGSGWNGFTPNHLKFFSPSTLPLLLKRAGFAAVAIKPMYGDKIEAGTTVKGDLTQRRIRRIVERGNRGNMMRAVAFADADGLERYGLEGERL
jgi:SAM-dependent methyltransferase